VLYHCSQFVHRSRDRGQSWEVISSDLTRNDPTRQGYAGGAITRDNTGVEVYGALFAFEPSPHERGLLWAGTDDGRVHLSRDDGASWTEITPRGMPEWGQVNSIELSPHEAGRAFLAVTRYKFDDFAPYLFRTDDYGKSWKRLTDGKNGIPADHFVRVVREDPERRGLLYAGTEFGIYVSFDDGRHWQELQLELPVTPITDLAVTADDLVVATQGRAFWILDDLTPLQQMSDEVGNSELYLFAPRAALRLGGGLSFGGAGSAGQNPPAGAVIHYVLGAAPAEDAELVLEILDGDGELLRSFSSTTPEPRAPNPFRDFLPESDEPRLLPVEAGMNRFVWDLRLRDARLVEDAILWGLARGPRIAPGTYRARLRLGELERTREFEVRADPRLAVTRAEIDEQFALARRVWATLEESHQAIRRVRDIRQQVRDLTRRLDGAGHGDGLAAASGELEIALTALERKLTQPRGEAIQDVLNFPPQLDGQLIGLLSIVDGVDAPPTDGSIERFDDLRAELDRGLAELRGVIEHELAAFNALVERKSVPPVIVPGPDF